jgi:multidrug efflux pump subunit AcrB
MLPKADRNCFAVEIHLADGCTLKQTEAVADSMEEVLRADPRVTSVTSFIGCSSPRFHAAYAPQMAHKNYAQFIVNTTSEENTIKIIREYSPKYENHFPNGYIRFKQIDYQVVNNPVEVRFSGDDFNALKMAADSLKNFMNTLPELTWVHSNMDETSQDIKVSLKSDEATRLGVTQSALSIYLSAALGGQNLTNVWEGDYKVPVMLYTRKHGDTISYQAMEDMLVPTSMPGVWVPLRQVAEIGPEWHDAVINRRNSIRTVTVGADLTYGQSQPEVMKKIDKYLQKKSMPEGVEISYGGLTGVNGMVIPEIALSFLAAVLVLFIFLLYHFGRLDVVFLTLSASLICVFGACLGLWVFGLDFSITAVLGVVSLIGIIVRNAIIMFEYAENLRKNHRFSAKEAAFEAGKRRMRPIFLTSATTALGVMPMIVAHTALWMPMGVVICFGTIFSLPLVVTVLPVAYWQVFK